MSFSCKGSKAIQADKDQIQNKIIEETCKRIQANGKLSEQMKATLIKEMCREIPFEQLQNEIHVEKVNGHVCRSLKDLEINKKNPRKFQPDINIFWSKLCCNSDRTGLTKEEKKQAKNLIKQLK